MAANSTHHSQTAAVAQDGEKMELRRGPWTVEEDLILINYVAKHGEGRWKSVARCSGLTRTGNSCRLRWLNYLRPEVRRGNITPEEQLLILELHSRWGNRWSKIAQHLPGRTDNEIKNYWRTRVQRHAKLLKCDVNSQQFKDVISGLWVPRLMDRVHTSSAGSAAAASNPCVAPWAPTAELLQPPPPVFAHLKHCPDISSIAGSWSELTSAVTRLSSPSASDVMDYPIIEGGIINVQVYGDEISTGEAVGGASGRSESLLSPYVCLSQGFPEFEQNGWGAAGEFSSESLWTEDDLLFLHQQL